MAQLFKNNAFSALAASLTNVATTLTVSTGHGDRFPAVTGADFFMLTLQDASNNIEIVKVTARTAGADAMTIVRAQDGFTASAWNMGDVVELRVTSYALNPLSVFAGAATAQAMRDAMGAVGTTGDQTIAGAKTFSSQMRISANGLANMYHSTFAGDSNYNVEQGWDDTGLFWNIGSEIRGVRWIKNGTTNLLSFDSAGNLSLLGALVFPDGSSAITTARGLFRKSAPDNPAWTKTGAGTATTASTLHVEVAGAIKTIASGASITMPTLAAGTDYAIWCKPDGTLEATSNHMSPPVANSRKLGGFHYAPGGHSGAPGGGNTTPGIWAGSFWDLKWRPNCPDPRGMEYWCGSWMDMYLTGVDAITNGSSKYNVTMADGSSPPKVPTIFGGNGSTTYGSYSWFEASELAMAMGKRLPTQREFMAHAYGTTEQSSIGTDQGSTILNAAYTSAAGLFQATGVLGIWGDDRYGSESMSGDYSLPSWQTYTNGRGAEYWAPCAVLFGGHFSSVLHAGSRSSYWGFSAGDSDPYTGSRFCCDHLHLD